MPSLKEISKRLSLSHSNIKKHKKDGLLGNSCRDNSVEKMSSQNADEDTITERTSRSSDSSSEITWNAQMSHQDEFRIMSAAIKSPRRGSMNFSDRRSYSSRRSYVGGFAAAAYEAARDDYERSVHLR